MEQAGSLTFFTKSQLTLEIKKPVSSAHAHTHTHKLHYPPKLLIHIKKKKYGRLPKDYKTIEERGKVKPS